MELQFRKRLPGITDSHTDAISYFLGALRHNGQVVGRESPTAAVENGYRTFVMAPRQDALAPSRDSPWVRTGRERLEAAGLEQPSTTLIGADPGSAEPCWCSHRSLFILYTDYVTLESPLRCGDCFGPIPLYEIPATADEEYHDVMTWQSDYQACDTLQMNCSTGERFGLREMGNANSSLARRGREICRRIEELTGIPTYYPLHRYGGRTQATERRRPCPSCDGEWLLPERLHEQFDFMCAPCRLLSNISPSV